MKIVFKIISIILILATMLYLVVEITFGIHFKGTLSTKYSKVDNSQIIETSHFKIKTPTDWIHIFNGYGNEGNACGSFLTKSGIISYDYGMFTNNYEVDSINVFSSDSLIVNRFNVIIGKNKENEIGIYIPRQNNMEWPLSINLNKTSPENYEVIIKGIEEMLFKKFYNFNKN